MKSNKNIPVKLYLNSELCTSGTKRAKELNLSMSSLCGSLLAREVSKPITCANSSANVVVISRPKVAQKRVHHVNNAVRRMPVGFRLRN